MKDSSEPTVSLSYLAYGARRCVALTRTGEVCRRITRIEIDGFGPVCCTHLERESDRLNAMVGHTPAEQDDPEHFPWHYTEFGVVCACGAPMRDEVCLASEVTA